MGWDEHTFVILGVRVPPTVFFRKVERTLKRTCSCPASSDPVNFCWNCGERLRETVTENEPVFEVIDEDLNSDTERVQIGDQLFDVVVIPDYPADDDSNDRVIGIALFENNTIRRAGGELYRTARMVREDAIQKMRDIFRSNGLSQEISDEGAPQPPAARRPQMVMSTTRRRSGCLSQRDRESKPPSSGSVVSNETHLVLGG